MNKQNLYDQLSIDEGVVREIYLDHLGYPTFGIGHLITKDDPEYGLPIGTEIDDVRVWGAFEKDLDTACSECTRLFGNKFLMWPDEVQEILVNMMFNLGRPRLSKFVKFRQALDNKDWPQAALEGRDSLWYHQVGARAERLMSRLEKVS